MAKRAQYFRRNWSILVAQLLLPFLLSCFCLALIRSKITTFATRYEPLVLNIRSVYGETDGFYGYKPPALELAKEFEKVLDANSVRAKNVSGPLEYVLEYGRQDTARYLKNLIVGGTVDEDSNGNYNLTAWFNGEPHHAAPMSLLLMHTAVLQKVSDTNKTEAVIDLTNAPLPERNRVSFKEPAMPRIIPAIFVPLTFAFLSASFALLPIHERATKVKLLQMMCGVPKALYWTSMFLWDFLVHCVVCILLILPYAICAPYAFFGKHLKALGTALLLKFLYGLPSIPFSYLLSLLFKRGNTGFFAVIGICVIIGCVAIVLVNLLLFGDVHLDIFGVETSVWAFRIFPIFSLTMGLSNLYGIAFDNALCESLSETTLVMSCNQSSIDRRNPIFGCCEEICGDDCKKSVNPITLKRNACGIDMIVLAVLGLIYFALLLVLEYFLDSHALWELTSRLSKSQVEKHLTNPPVPDPDVLEEEGRIRDLVAVKSGSGDEALSLLELTKVYPPLCVINQLTFGIRRQECFGLLGVNGAGKTTTFRLLTGDSRPSKGNAFIENLSLRRNLKQFQSRLGYCPQEDALIDRLTGREMLTLFGRLRGLGRREVKERVEEMIAAIGLERDADTQTRHYTGGGKRKLSFAIALIGSPPLILLDEPTAGIDPVSRRKIWSILEQVKSKPNAAILLTTQSMQETEALCTRLGMLVNGRLRCLGSVHRLRSKFGRGRTVTMKARSRRRGDAEFVKEIKDHVESNLGGATLKDELQGILQYHVVDSDATLSSLFTFMSETKEKFDLEEYLISDTSLEQVFLALARAQADFCE